MDGEYCIYMLKKILFIYQKWAFLTNNIEIKRYKTFDSGGGGVKSFVN